MFQAASSSGQRILERENDKTTSLVLFRFWYSSSVCLPIFTFQRLLISIPCNLSFIIAFHGRQRLACVYSILPGIRTQDICFLSPRIFPPLATAPWFLLGNSLLPTFSPDVSRGVGPTYDSGYGKWFRPKTIHSTHSPGQIDWISIGHITHSEPSFLLEFRERAPVLPLLDLNLENFRPRSCWWLYWNHRGKLVWAEEGREEKTYPFIIIWSLGQMLPETG